MTPLRRTSIATVVLAILGLSLTACGSEAKSADGAEKAVRDYLDAMDHSHWSSACDRLTDDYAQSAIDDWNGSEMSGEDKVDSCEEMMKLGAVLIKGFGGDDALKTDKVHGRLADGTTHAEVHVDYQGDVDPDTYVLVYDDGKWLIDDEHTAEDSSDSPSDSATDEPSEDAAEGSATPTSPTAAPSSPSALGDPVKVGEWRIKVTDIQPDAGDAIAKANQFNDKPEHTYVLVTYRATYQGSARTGDVESDLTWTLITSDQQVHDEASEVTPAENSEWPTAARTGGTVKAQAVFDVDPTLLEGAIVSVETYTDSGDTAYADIAVPSQP